MSSNFGPTARLGYVGTWGTGIFSNDIACDVRGEYRELLEDGLPDAEATQEVLRRFKDAGTDPDNGVGFWTGLAATQVQLGRIETGIRDSTVAAIDSGGDLHMWEDPERGKRKAVLAKLRAQLLGPQKLPVKVRRPGRIPCPLQAGDVFLLTLADGRKARLRTLAVEGHRLGDFPIVELIDRRGRRFRQYRGDDAFDPVGSKEKWARFEIVDGIRDVPRPEDIQVVARGAPPKGPVTVITSMGWRALRMECARLLDEPGAQPQRGLFR